MRGTDHMARGGGLDEAKREFYGMAEGGFSPEEREQIRALLGLGPFAAAAGQETE
jgi:hypothetical protein